MGDEMDGGRRASPIARRLHLVESEGRYLRRNTACVIFCPAGQHEDDKDRNPFWKKEFAGKSYGS